MQGGWLAYCRVDGCEDWETYAILRHIVCGSGDSTRVDGRGWKGGGEGGGRQDGIKYPCCEITDRIYRRQREWAIDDGKRKRWVDGFSLPFLCASGDFSFFLFLFLIQRPGAD